LRRTKRPSGDRIRRSRTCDSGSGLPPATDPVATARCLRGHG
jgi:hypothetical protein